MSPLKALAQAILTNAASYSWSLQGFGMLRLHLPGHYRLHVWDSRYRAPNVSMIHDHLQWGLQSTVIAGVLQNQRYAEVGADSGEPYNVVTLKPGVGCFFKDQARLVRLRTQLRETYFEGDSYAQAPSEVHESMPEDGTVTLMLKAPTGDESARVFWPVGTEWGSAEPRAASPQEVAIITRRALERWFQHG